MRAIEAREAGSPDVLHLVERDSPSPAPGQILVRTAAAGVNFIDTYLRSGVYPSSYPHVPGSEGAGDVIAIGAGVRDIAVGEVVAWAQSVTGSYASEVLVEAERAVRVPEGVEARTAAAVMLQGMTAHMLVDGVCTVQAGQDVLLTAGAGGVGLLLTQLAAARGARVITTVSTAAKEELSRAAGAADVIRTSGLEDLTTELPAIVRSLTAGAGVHVAYDGVGADTFDGTLASVRTRGLMVLFGGASGQVPPFDLQRLNRAGSLFVTRPSLWPYIATREELTLRADAVLGAVRSGTLAVHVGGTYALDQAAQAHRALEGRATTGKLVLIP